MSPSTIRVRGYTPNDVVGVVADRQSYKNLAYLLLALPLGFVYGMPLLFGFAFGLFFSIFLIGIPILIATVLGTRLAAALERVVANALLDVDLESPDDVSTGSDDGPAATIHAYLDAASTWRGLGFVLLKFWVGFLGVLLLIALVGILSVLTAPLHYPYEAELITVNDEPITWTIETFPESILAVGVGAILAVVFLHLSNGFAYVTGRMALALLDGPNPAGTPAKGFDERPSNEPQTDEPLTGESRTDETPSGGSRTHGSESGDAADEPTADRLDGRPFRESEESNTDRSN